MFKIYEIENYFDYQNDYDTSSIKEVNSVLEKGEYFIMIYPESSINEAVIRFLSEKEIDIKLINKLNKNDLFNLNGESFSSKKIFSEIFNFENHDDTYNYKIYLELEENNSLFEICKKEYFLPGIKEYYSHFNTIAKKRVYTQKMLYMIFQKMVMLIYILL